MGKPDALLGQLVEVGRFVEGIPIATEFRPPEVVGKNEDDVRLAVFGKSQDAEVTKGEQGQD